jgi:mono/diheme cytochrome c family protein
MKMSRALVVMVPFLLGFLVVSGCDTESYSKNLAYPVRTDPLILGEGIKETGPDYPDRPGVLPISLFKEVSEPKNPLYLAAKNNPQAFVDVGQLSAEDRAEFQSSLEEIFGTPAEPTVRGNLNDDARRVLKLDDDTLALGSREYRKLCLYCHGLTGDGRGPTAKWVNPHPRDYRRGIFKFTSTDLEQGVRRPSRADLMRTLRQGIEGTAMPSFNLLEDEKLDALVSYVIHLSMRGQTEFVVMQAWLGSNPKTYGSTISSSLQKVFNRMVDNVADTWLKAQKEENGIKTKGTYPQEYGEVSQLPPDSVQRGYKLYLEKGCTTCHINFGRQSPFRFDAWGTLARPMDLTKGVYRGGRRPVDLFYRIHRGIPGSGMLELGKNLTSTEIWDLVNFLRALPYAPMRQGLQPEIKLD